METERDMVRSRLIREADFHDKRIYQHASEAGEERRSQSKYYWTVEKYDDSIWQKIMHVSKGKRVLELGCFDGQRTVSVSRVAHSVVGIDISQNAVDSTNDLLSRSGCTNALAQVANAEQLPFGDSEFDVVFGTGIIHHVDVESAAIEIKRVLRVGGYALFREPLGHNPLINIYRMLTPLARTKDEHPLSLKDIAQFKTLFSIQESEFFGLFCILSTPFRGVRLGGALRNILTNIDDALLRIDVLKRYAWQVNLVMRKEAS